MKKLLLLLLLTLLTFDYAAADLATGSYDSSVITIDEVSYKCMDPAYAIVIAIDDNKLTGDITIPSSVTKNGKEYNVVDLGDELLKDKTFKKIIWESHSLRFGKNALNNASGIFETKNFVQIYTVTSTTECPLNNFNGTISINDSYASGLFDVLKDCNAPHMKLCTNAQDCKYLRDKFNDEGLTINFKIDQFEEAAILDLKFELDVLTFIVTCRSDIDKTKLIVTIDKEPVKESDGAYKIEGLMFEQDYRIYVHYKSPDGRNTSIYKEFWMSSPFVILHVNDISYQGELKLSYKIYYDSPYPESLFSKDSVYKLYYYKEKQNSFHGGILENTDSHDSRIFTGTIDNLSPDTYYDDIYFVIKKRDKVIYSEKLTGFYTAKLNCDYEYKSTQTTIILSKIELLLDGTYNPNPGALEYFNDNIKINSFPYKLTGLKPDDSRGFSVKNKDGKELCQFSINTLSLDAYPTNAGYGYDHSEGRNHYSSYQPTTYIFKPYAGKNDCDIESYHFYGELFGNKMVTCKPGEQLVATGLKPGGKNRFEFWVTLKNDNSSKKYSYSKNYIYTTGDLKLVTLQPRNVSATSSIVCAETNISDRETNVGFQWRKYDAPESLKSSEGYAAIYDGLMEGRINKLQSTSYYKVRAFYKSNSGEYYYGDWVTFYPSDFSYFEPTVYTYNIDYVTYNSAEVRGYVMAGSDEIIRQGFEYSATTSQAAPKRKYVAAAQTPTIILATGLVMTATLTDLEPSTTYTIRAFAETASGIVYGDEQVFTTDAFSGISDAIAEKDGRTPTVYYDLSGRRYDKPQHGVNIVVYDDGTVEKMLIKQQ